ncbi:MAG: chemotaxis-specific protein-glutamate methyltransferase CheB [Phycisphaerae bacterium]|nr:chemotaxis-specific protein-glutamate methyltransferase CheB [Phycisphaerae bacterium]
MASGKKIKVMILDDSLPIRTILEKELSKQPDMEVTAVVPDPAQLATLLVRYRPDVLILDLEMPKTDGMTLLGMALRVLPVRTIILSSHIEPNARVSPEMARRGVTDVMPKPGGGSFIALGKVMATLAEKVRAAARQRTPTAIKAPVNAEGPGGKGVLIALGASTGGTEALRFVLSQLPPDMPPIVIAQHMPESFTESFAASLHAASELTVVEAAAPIELRGGLVAVARGNTHLTVTARLAGYMAQPTQGELVCHQRPSVDVMFNSVALAVGSNAIGAIFTGMGEDGAAGLLAMRQSGAITIAQNEETCVVFGMPKEAIARGAAQHVLPLDRIPQALVNAVRRKSQEMTDTRPEPVGRR